MRIIPCPALHALSRPDSHSYVQICTELPCTHNNAPGHQNLNPSLPSLPPHTDIPRYYNTVALYCRSIDLQTALILLKRGTPQTPHHEASTCIAAYRDIRHLLDPNFARLLPSLLLLRYFPTDGQISSATSLSHNLDLARGKSHRSCLTPCPFICSKCPMQRSLVGENLLYMRASKSRSLTCAPPPRAACMPDSLLQPN